MNLECVLRVSIGRPWLAAPQGLGLKAAAVLKVYALPIVPEVWTEYLLVFFACNKDALARVLGDSD